MADARHVVEIAAPPQTVWDRIGRFGDMSWHPAIFSTDDPQGETVGAVRVLTLGQAGGPTVTEKLEARGAMRYRYSITAVDPSVLPVTRYHSELSVEPHARGSRVEWLGVFDAAGDASDEAAVETMTGVYRAGLEAAKQALESGG